jgi:hypothetical protein
MPVAIASAAGYLLRNGMVWLPSRGKVDDPSIRSRVGSSSEFYGRVSRMTEERRQCGDKMQARARQLDIHRPVQSPPSPHALQVVAGILARSRKPGGRHRAGQRAPGRNPPAPVLPVIPELVLGVLRRQWRTASGAPNPYRVRSLAGLAVAMAVPRGTTTLEFCRMLPDEVLRMTVPREGRRWLKRWFRIRAHWLDANQLETTPWLALPPMSRGMPRMIGWGVQQTFHRAGVPAWRLGQLLRARAHSGDLRP